MKLISPCCKNVQNYNPTKKAKKGDRRTTICKKCQKSFDITKELLINEETLVSPEEKSPSSTKNTRITKDYLEQEAIKIHKKEQNSQSLRTMIEVYKICYNGQDEDLIELDMNQFDLICKSIQENRNFRPTEEQIDFKRSDIDSFDYDYDNEDFSEEEDDKEPFEEKFKPLSTSSNSNIDIFGKPARF